MKPAKEYRATNKISPKVQYIDLDKDAGIIKPNTNLYAIKLVFVTKAICIKTRTNTCFSTQDCQSNHICIYMHMYHPWKQSAHYIVMLGPLVRADAAHPP